MFPLHKAPAGLLELLRLRTNGEQPNRFSSDVVPVIDAGKFYGADVVLSDNATSGAGALPRNVTDVVQVSSGVARYLAISVQLTIGAAAGTSWSVLIGVRRTPATTIVWLGGGTLFQPLANTPYVFACNLAEPLCMVPGGNLVASAYGNAGGADHLLELKVLYERLDGSQ